MKSSRDFSVCLTVQKDRLPSMIFRIIALKDMYIVIPGTCEYVAVVGEGDFAGAIKLRILRRSDNPGIPWGVQRNYKDPITRR